MDINFPIKLRLSAAKLSTVLAVGAFFIGVSFLLFGADGTTRVPFFGYVPKQTVSYVFFFLGVAILIAGVNAFIMERPSLLVDADGLVFTPNFGSVRRLAWSEIEEIKAVSSRYDKSVVIRTRAAKFQKIPAFSQGSPDELCYLLQRCAEAAAKARKQSKAAPTSGADRS